MTGVDDLADAQAQAPCKPRKGSALPSPAPQGGGLGELLDWLTGALRLPARVTRTERWGTNSDTPLTFVLADGTRLRFDATRDLFDAGRLVQGVCLPLGADAPQLPLFSRADAQDVALVVIRACEAVERDDERERTRDWQEDVLRIAHTVDGGEYSDAAARWDGLRWLTDWPPFDAHAYRVDPESDRCRPARLRWADGSAFVRVTDVETFVRLTRGQQISTGQLVARMREAGWEHRRVDARRPGAGRDRGGDDRVRASVLIAPPSDEREHARNGVSPSVPIGNRARDARAHASVATGSLGTHEGPPVNAGKPELGDTSELGDTLPTATAEAEREAGPAGGMNGRPATTAEEAELERARHKFGDLS